MNRRRFLKYAAALMIVMTSGLVVFAVTQAIGVSFHWRHGISAVVHVAVSSDGQLIAAVSSDTGAYVFTADGKQLWNRRPAAGEGFKSVAISSDGQYVVAGQDDEAAIGRAAVYLYAAQDGRQLWNYETGGLVWSVAASSDGKYIAAGSWDHKVYLFSRDSGTPLWSYEAKLGFKSVAVSSDGQYIAAASYDGLYMFDRASREPMWNYSQYGAFNTVAISSDGQYVAAGSSGDDSILLFKRDGAVLWRNPAGGDPLSVAISSDGQYVVAGSEGSAGKVSLFDLNNTPLWSHPVGKAVESVAISSDARYVAAGGDDRTVYIFRRDTGAQIFSYPVENTAFSVDFSSNGQSIAAGGAGAVFHFVMSPWSLQLVADSLRGHATELLIAILGASVVVILVGRYCHAHGFGRKQLRNARYLWGCLNRNSFKAGFLSTVGSVTLLSALSASIWRMIVAALGTALMLSVGSSLLLVPFILLLLFRERRLHSAISSALGVVLATGAICTAVSLLALVGAL